MTDTNQGSSILNIGQDTQKASGVHTVRENALAILNRQQPDYYFDFMDSLSFAPDPIFLADLVPIDGEPHLDSWGSEFVWQPGAPGQHPTGRAESLVIKDIEEWQDDLVVPSLEGLDWSVAKEAAAATDKSEKFVAAFSSGGLFERSHHLMSFEEALVNYMTYEEEMAELLRVIADFKIAWIKKAAEEFSPEVLFYQDDWGSKTNVFLPPEIWRRLIKPLTKEIVDVAHECGMLFVLHCDCYAEPLAPDMVEIGVDIWQGVIPQNDILAIQKATDSPKGPLAMIGGIDGPKIDVAGIAEEDIRAEIRRAVDTYCPAGRFYPGIANGQCFNEWNDGIFRDELAKYGREWAENHPVN